MRARGLICVTAAPTIFRRTEKGKNANGKHAQFWTTFQTDSSHADEHQAEKDRLAKIKSPYFITNALKFLPEQMIGFVASYWKLTDVRLHKNQSKSGQRPIK